MDHVVTRPPTPARAVLKRYLTDLDAPTVALAAAQPTLAQGLRLVERCFAGEDLVRTTEARQAVVRLREGLPTLVGDVCLTPPPAAPQAAPAARALAAAPPVPTGPPTAPPGPRYGPAFQRLKLLRDTRPTRDGTLYARGVEAALHEVQLRLIREAIDMALAAGYPVGPFPDGTYLQRDAPNELELRR